HHDRSTLKHQLDTHRRRRVPQPRARVRPWRTRRRAPCTVTEASMQVPVRVSFRNTVHSPRLVDLARRHAERLARLVRDRVRDCQVTLERTSPRAGGYRARIDLAVEGREVVATRVSAVTQSMSDAYLALGAAFDTARRQILDGRERRRD